MIGSGARSWSIREEMLSASIRFFMGALLRAHHIGHKRRVVRAFWSRR